MPREKTCPTCQSVFVVDSPKSRQKFCCDDCRPGRKPLPPRRCVVCYSEFIPDHGIQQICSKTCRSKRLSEVKTIKKDDITCPTCGSIFTPKKKETYCSHSCYASRHGDVTKTCAVCDKEFTVPYRFREKKTCSRECFSRLASINASSPTKEAVCLACGKKTTVAENDERQYCSYPCFLSTRKTRQADVEITCEGCSCKFLVPFPQADLRKFCGKSCANSGENNPSYGKKGIPTGRPAWTKGLTKETDPRIAASAQKNSAIIAQKLVDGEWTHRCFGFKGEHYVGLKNGGEATYLRSSYESQYARILDADAEVVEWTHEPFKIPYLFDGFVKNYVPDFLVRRTDGTNSLVEVKPKMLTDSPVNLAKSEAARRWCADNEANYLVVTEDALG